MDVRCLTAVTRACKGFEELAPSAWTDYQTELSKALEILSRCSSALSHGPQTSRALYRAIEELERLQATRKAREDSARSTDAEAAPTSPESNEGGLWWAVVSCSIGWIVFYINSFIKHSSAVLSPPLILFLELSAVTFLLLLVLFWRHNQFAYKRRYSQWERSFLCQRCGAPTEQE
jgi:hypothetical protein